jgi:hypothetical protein
MRTIRSIAAAGTLALGIAIASQALSANSLAASAAARAFPQNQNDPFSVLSVFTGTIQKVGDGYIFNDDRTRSPYKLDDQQSASKFEGQRVKIIGALDARNNLIRVQNIEASNA